MQIQFDPLDHLALLCMHTNYGAKGSKGSNYTPPSGTGRHFRAHFSRAIASSYVSERSEAEDGIEKSVSRKWPLRSTSLI